MASAARTWCNSRATLRLNPVPTLPNACTTRKAAHPPLRGAFSASSSVVFFSVHPRCLGNTREPPGKPIAIESASPGPLGGGRVQYDLRRMLVFLDALTLNKPEVFMGGCAAKFDDKTGDLKDDATGNFIKQQLEAFAKFIERHGRKA